MASTRARFASCFGSGSRAAFALLPAPPRSSDERPHALLARRARQRPDESKRRVARRVAIAKAERVASSPAGSSGTTRVRAGRRRRRG